MNLWRIGLIGLVIVNVLLLAAQLGGVGHPQMHMQEPGLRAEWVKLVQPWVQAEDATQSSSTAPQAQPPKIDLKAGQLELQEAIETASNGVFNNQALNLECRLWGPLLQGDDVRVQEALRDWPGQVDRLERQVPVGYVVYLPKSVVDAGQSMGQLAGKGVTDAFYMNTPGPMQGTISLGLFRDQQRAIQHQSELRAKGVLGVEIRERLGPTRIFFELRGSPTQVAELQQMYTLNPKGELKNCPQVP
ncbi:MAG TPA: hypothetical protein VFV57_05195 [Limnobacter sp.]|nr:hypothetical protein [Limnobacter sp.]